MDEIQAHSLADMVKHDQQMGRHAILRPGRMPFILCTLLSVRIGQLQKAENLRFPASKHNETGNERMAKNPLPGVLEIEKA